MSQFQMPGGFMYPYPRRNPYQQQYPMQPQPQPMQYPIQPRVGVGGATGPGGVAMSPASPRPVAPRPIDAPTPSLNNMPWPAVPQQISSLFGQSAPTSLPYTAATEMAATQLRGQLRGASRNMLSSAANADRMMQERANSTAARMIDPLMRRESRLDRVDDAMDIGVNHDQLIAKTGGTGFMQRMGNRPSSSLAAGMGAYSPWEQDRLSQVGMPVPAGPVLPPDATMNQRVIARGGIDRAAAYAPTVAGMNDFGFGNTPESYEDGTWRNTPEGRRNHTEALRALGTENPVNRPSGPNLENEADRDAWSRNRTAAVESDRKLQQRLDDGWQRQIANSQNRLLRDHPIFGLPGLGGMAGQLAVGMSSDSIADMQRADSYAGIQGRQMGIQEAAAAAESRRADERAALQQAALAIGDGTGMTPEQRTAIIQKFGGMANPNMMLPSIGGAAGASGMAGGTGAVQAPLTPPPDVNFSNPSQSLRYFSTQPGLNAETLTRYGYGPERLQSILKEDQKYLPGVPYLTAAGRREEAEAKRIAEDLLRRHFPGIPIPAAADPGIGDGGYFNPYAPGL